MNKHISAGAHVKKQYINTDASTPRFIHILYIDKAQISAAHVILRNV